MRFSVRVLLCALSVACVACRDVPQAPIEPPPPAPSAFTVLLINTQFNVDYGPGFQQATLFADPGGEIDAVYEDFDDGTLRYSGCPVSCGDVRYWRSGVADSGAGFLYVAGYASAALDASGLHALYEGMAALRHPSPPRAPPPRSPSPPPPPPPPAVFDAHRCGAVART